VSWRQWFWQLLIALDQLANVLITPGSDAAWADETMSSRAFRMWVKGKPWGLIFKPTIDFLFRWQSANHCEEAYRSERQRLYSPPEMR